MAESNNNRQYFNSEASKNRDTWKYADAGTERTLRIGNVRTNLYATGKFDDVLRAEKWHNADSESENEDSVEYENELPEEEFTEEELPKFRHLVRAKKLEYKAQYGKAHLQTKTAYKKVCLGGWVDIKGDGKGPIWKSDINCTNIPYPQITWVWGWRKKWREFKQAGGLAQLKMQSKGTAPIPGYVPDANAGNGSGTGTGTGTGNKPPKPDITLDLPEKQEASMVTNVVGGILVVGLLIGIFKTLK